MDDRLYRSRDDRVIAGVCGGIADRYDLDPALVRIAFAFLILAWGVGLLLYVVMAIVVPEEPLLGPASGGVPPAPAGMPAAGGSMPAAGGSLPAAGGSTPPEAGSAGSPSDAASPVTERAAPGWVPPTQPGWDERQSARWAARDARRAARAARRAARGSDSGGLLFGLILVLVGAYFFIRNYLPAIDLDRTWPLLVIGIGIVLIVGAVGAGRSRPPV